MAQEMLLATQQAAWAAQSAAEAAWWALAVNGAVVVVAIGTTFFQEWRVSRRVRAERKELHDGAADTLRRGKIALERAAAPFHEAGDVSAQKVEEMGAKLARARRLIALFTSREVNPSILILLIQMDDLLAQGEGVCETAANVARRSRVGNASFNGRIDNMVVSAQRLVDRLE